MAAGFIGQAGPTLGPTGVPGSLSHPSASMSAETYPCQELSGLKAK